MNWCYNKHINIRLEITFKWFNNMNIQTVAQNLRKTIAGKEEALALYESRRDIPRATGHQMAIIATIEFLKINIDELKKILADVEQCVEKDVEQSWRDSPDRSGGQFTQDEIDNASAWR